MYAEVGNALLVEQRAGALPASELVTILDEVLRFPLGVFPARGLTRDAVAVASARGLSVYDGFYVVLAEANSAVLVTADRKLAAACARSELLT